MYVEPSTDRGKEEEEGGRREEEPLRLGNGQQIQSSFCQPCVCQAEPARAIRGVASQHLANQRCLIDVFVGVYVCARGCPELVRSGANLRCDTLECVFVCVCVRVCFCVCVCGCMRVRRPISKAKGRDRRIPCSHWKTRTEDTLVFRWKTR